MCIEIECHSENDVPIQYLHNALELLEEMTLEGKWFLHYLRTIIKHDKNLPALLFWKYCAWRNKY